MADHHHHVNEEGSSRSSPTAPYVTMEQRRATKRPEIDLTEPEIDLTEAYVDRLTPAEIMKLRHLLMSVPTYADITAIHASPTEESGDSEYPEFARSTHAWAVFADYPERRATYMDRIVGTLIIIFQLFTYWMFAAEAVDDYGRGQVVLYTSHGNCVESNQQPYDNFMCEADYTNEIDAFIAYFMLGIFLTPDILQAYRAICAAPYGTPLFFALLAGIEVTCAFMSACVAISYNLFVGEVTDAVEVGVGLLFIRELSSRAYSGIRNGKTKRYTAFFCVLSTLVIAGMLVDPIFERLYANRSL